MKYARSPIIVMLLCCFAATRALGHGGEHHEGSTRVVGPRNWGELGRSWGLEPGIVIPLALSALLYARGVARLWRGGAGRGVSRIDAGCFAAGWLALVVALVSPLHPWGSVLFSAHMTQHEILMLVAAPLLVLGRPMVATLKALPAGWARAMVHWSRTPAWSRLWHLLTNPFAAWPIHAGVLWAWHIPILFQATLDDEFVHALQHLSFLLSSLLFWWALLHGADRRVRFGVGVAYLFTTAVHSGLLGALITLAKTVWYPAYSLTTASWGLTPLEDQQLGGLIMWIPACSVYLVAGLALFAGWLREAGRSSRKWEAATLGSPARSPSAERPSPCAIPPES